MLIEILLLIIGFVFLIKGADYLVEGSSDLASKLGVSDLIIGLTIVAFGTSAPELIVSIIGSLTGNNQIVLGNVIGSNLFNTLLIIGICGTIWKVTIKRKMLANEIPLFFIGSVLLVIFGNDIINLGTGISKLDGSILFIGFLIFVIYTIYQTKIISSKKENNKENEYKEENEDVSIDHNTKSTIKIICYILMGILGLYFGGNFVVDNAVLIANKLGISQKIIAVTIVACGTSLPELVASISAMKKNKVDMVIGNIVGSNIFNLGLVLGLSSIISPISYDLSFNIDLAFFLIGTSILILSMYIGKKYTLNKIQAISLFVLYIIYMYVVIV